nr:hypothetical protein [Clostridium paraputrificum]
MAKSERITFLLNKENPKDKLILDLLSDQYNKSDFIRDILYKVAAFNGDNTITTPLSRYDNTITTPLSYDDNSMITPLQYDDNSIITPLSHHDNTITIPLSCDDNEFKVDISKVEDDEVDLSVSSSSDPSQNALDFLKDM